MNPNIHNPVRYGDETQDQYRNRRRFSNHVNKIAKGGKLVHDSMRRGIAIADADKTSRREVVAVIGIRQVKRLRSQKLRNVRELMKLRAQLVA